MNETATLVTTMPQIFFWVPAMIAVIATVLVITRSHPVHALLYLIVSLLAVALLFYYFGAPFAAALEVIIYAGAIMVLFVFVVMMLNLGSEPGRKEASLLRGTMWIGPGVLAFVLFAEFIAIFGRGTQLVSRTPAAVAPGMVQAREVGKALYGPYVLGVELASFLLLAGLVAAFHIGRQKDERSTR